METDCKSVGPEGHSVNDGIDKALASLSYVSIDQVAAGINKHPDDRPLLGMLWEDKVYIDCALPFGLRSAPLIFTAIADAMQWIMERRGIAHLFHYIDDFITLGTPESAVCSWNSTLMHEICKEMGLPAEPEKDEGPATSITFLGMELDSMAMEIRLPREKLEAVRHAKKGSCSPLLGPSPTPVRQ